MPFLNCGAVGTMENRDQRKLVENVKLVTATFSEFDRLVMQTAGETELARLFQFMTASFGIALLKFRNLPRRVRHWQKSPWDDR